MALHMKTVPESRPRHYEKELTTIVTKRYRPGQIPEWADRPDLPEPTPAAPTAPPVFPVAVPAPQAVLDRRLARLQARQNEIAPHQVREREVIQAQIIDDDDDDVDTRAEKHHSGMDVERPTQDELATRMAHMEVVSDHEQEDDTEDAEARFAQRQALREKIKQQAAAREAAKPAPAPEEEESEWETDSEDDAEDDPFFRRMPKPKFIRKEARDTVREREKLIEQEEHIEEDRIRRLQERKEETRHIIQEEIQKERQAELNPEHADDEQSDEEMPNTDDDADEAGQYEQWKLRELKRIKRDREERDAMLKEREEVERRRNLTDAERRLEDREYDAAHPKPAKKKWNFLQKYYHKGAFHMETSERFETKEPLYSRDYSAAVGEDKLDKSILPKVMQVKHFGRSGRTKYTHLVDQDTTAWDNPWAYNGELRAKYNNKLGGVGDIASRPPRKRGRAG
eukprot:gnl/Spiro4/100_TR55_c0_g2_i1.p1 gnl/Spiro4/100_TR55_c0_g2~~gnl/Spiro4/100_TR55_c0_g2_i1.p1  ORF type:complete len:454 (-),score=137.87 gnl/Spiro4/100_TR55_c0_g2_i1:71-1432(-)